MKEREREGGDREREMKEKVLSITEFNIFYDKALYIYIYVKYIYTYILNKYTDDISI